MANITKLANSLPRSVMVTPLRQTIACRLIRVNPGNVANIEDDEELQYLRKDSCPAEKQIQYREEKNAKEIKSMWEHPNCCSIPTPKVTPRMDDLHYKPKQQEDRVYNQTWVDFPVQTVTKKQRTYYDENEDLPMTKRPASERPKTAGEDTVLRRDMRTK